MAYSFRDGRWHLNEIALEQFIGTRRRPFYLYDLEDARLRARAFLKFGASVHYAMKANSNARLLNVFKDEGLGVDVVSLGELQRALQLGFDPKRIVFSGVGKDAEELEAAVHHRILQINVESFEELVALGEIAGSRAVDVGLRVNIHLEAPTHKHIQTATRSSKFGIDEEQLPPVLDWLKSHPHVRLTALAVHIGSQITDVSVFGAMSRRLGELCRAVSAKGFALARLDLGGGLGIDYAATAESDFARLPDYFAEINKHASGAGILLEPGRFLTARMGVLLTPVVYVKRGVERTFAILGAGMNALMRPALYQAYHRIEPLNPRSTRATYDIVGPVCESTDTFATAREMPELRAGDWVAIFDAGAYGAVMANTYNETPVPEQLSFLDGRLEIT